MVTEDLINSFVSIGLSAEKAKETAKNDNVAKNLKAIIDQARKTKGDNISKPVGNLLYALASKVKSQAAPHIPLLTQYVVDEKITSELQLNAALDFTLHHAAAGDFSNSDFEKACGVGVTYTDDDVKKAVASTIAANQKGLVENRYRFVVGPLLVDARKAIPWVDGKRLKDELDAQILALLGPKTAEDNEKPVKKKEKAPAEAGKEAAKPETSGAPTVTELMRTRVHFHKPGENYKTDGYVITPKTMELMKEHLKRTGGKIVTRFPPEPNGILHIGHAKAINIDFGYAEANGGVCYLRYDDTNPEKEEEKFFTAIKDMVEWLGYKPYKITHSSDYFQELYDFAVELIKRGQAYVCHQKPEEIKGFNPPPSPWKDRPIEESLKLFEDMKNGLFDEGAATLRMRTVLEEGKVDPVAYRIKYVPHHRTGDKWCIYPTYDYTHCLCDSLEDISHSLCTKEFQQRRSSYYWLCNALDLYCPVQWEYGRLNVNYTVTSKRKIAKLIETQSVRDWDDPRLFTLTALRRRGFPPEAINNFCALLGVTMAETAVDPQVVESCVRDYLNIHAPRTMVVLESLKVTITNFPHKEAIQVEALDFPEKPERGKHTIAFGPVIYIEQSDFRKDADKNYKRLTPNQSVGLRYSGVTLTVNQVVDDKDGNPVELLVECHAVTNDSEKPKGWIHWVSDPMPVEVRLYERLFKHVDPSSAPGGFLADMVPDSMRIIPNALADKHIKGAKVYNRFQFERVGFFSVDPDSTGEQSYGLAKRRCGQEMRGYFRGFL
ncbi:probable glutamine--tRNA ligase isoform X1 [Paramacrobiotus metropolitanus]|uniref:probable glutamine--tRNA ligase isoform X1 n=1 Tax=Paramacrobiotus metropolitanus TaxID=2943436 RepID=UPI00244599A2|nr:probable glutamine--tRNA ligase isoform X1 [Paramacrobiotus metropolitanus]